MKSNRSARSSCSSLPPPFQISRRTFLRRCSAAAVAAGVPLWFAERACAAGAVQPKPRGPNDRPGLALVGCGGMGTGDIRTAGGYGDIIAVCDVDANQAAKLVERLEGDEKPAPRVYGDFRALLERDDIDVIVNATPDHWHSLINIAAARAGKDIYAEKPLTLAIDEGNHVIKAVRDRGVVLQTGTQQRSMARFRLACELVRNGRLGGLREVHVWLPAGLRDGPFATAAVPEGLDWDYWLGQAPRVDYVPERCHRTFRFWYDYSGGTMTDWGAHHNDIAYWAIGLPAPRSVVATRLAEPVAGGYDTHSEYEIAYTYATGVRLIVHTTRDDSIYGVKLNAEGQRNGLRFEGTDGWIWVNRERIDASDPGLLAEPLPEDAIPLYQSSNHMENFFHCVGSREDPICNVETGHRSATMCHLGAVALRTGLPLTWDAARERFAGNNADAANVLLRREMREPYDYSFG
jgi:predicted dehydrogenase